MAREGGFGGWARDHRWHHVEEIHGAENGNRDDFLYQFISRENLAEDHWKSTPLVEG